MDASDEKKCSQQFIHAEISLIEAILVTICFMGNSALIHRGNNTI